MRLRDFAVLYFISFLIYIAGGDLFLPEPYRHNSKKVRDNINHYLVTIFPHKKSSPIQRINQKIPEFK